MGKKNKIVVIDSGIKLYPEFPSEIIKGCSIVHTEQDNFILSDDYNDNIGHGTAVVDKLLKETKTFGEIFCVKIFEDVVEVDTETLIYALNYVYENIKCDMVLISSGVTFCDKYNDLADSIARLHEQGVCIVSAFDNEGTVSFPAALDSVIGVGVATNDGEKVRVALNCMLDVVVPYQNYRLRWVSPPKVIIGGSSFAAPQIAALLSEIMIEVKADKADDETVDKITLLTKLAEKMDILCIDCERNDTSWQKGNAFVKNIRKAIVFPWNKEIHALVRFRDLLPFEIVGYYDIKYNLNIGCNVGDLIGVEEPIDSIKSIDNIRWEDEFDTIICGHCMEISSCCKRDFLKEIVENCQKYNKRLYAFDQEAVKLSISGNANIECYVPGIYENDVPKFMYGKLYERLTPVVGVFGTSSKQGKFTVQMELRKKFMEHGYQVGQVVSEPSGYLFGCNAVFPFGYHMNIHTNAADSVSIVNEMVWDASANSTNDIVIVGGQSGSVPYSYGNLSQMNFMGYNFLCGTNPDVFVLCINLHDEIEYIVRTIKYLESFHGMPVAAMIVFPLKYEVSSQILYAYKQRVIEKGEFLEFKQLLEQKTNIPVYLLGQSCDMEELYHIILGLLSED